MASQSTPAASAQASVERQSEAPLASASRPASSFALHSTAGRSVIASAANVSDVAQSQRPRIRRRRAVCRHDARSTQRSGCGCLVGLAPPRPRRSETRPWLVRRIRKRRRSKRLVGPICRARDHRAATGRCFGSRDFGRRTSARGSLLACEFRPRRCDCFGAVHGRGERRARNRQSCVGAPHRYQFRGPGFTAPTETIDIRRASRPVSGDKMSATSLGASIAQLAVSPTATPQATSVRFASPNDSPSFSTPIVMLGAGRSSAIEAPAVSELAASAPVPNDISASLDENEATTQRQALPASASPSAETSFAPRAAAVDARLDFRRIV